VPGRERPTLCPNPSRGRTAPTQVQRQIEEALKPIAEINAKNITVETEGDKVILRSQVTTD
jgi:osmotically-inducible protein OsmY